MKQTLSPRFLTDLGRVYATLEAPVLSSAFLAALAQVHTTLVVASEDNLALLAERFHAWRNSTREYVRARLVELSEDDPLRCPISLFRTMDSGRLETAHTRTLAWLVNPRGEHGFKNTLLAALLGRVSGRDCSAELAVERVESEVPIDGLGASGRLDVFAEGRWDSRKSSGWVLAIEAKIDAWEGTNQLQKYDAWLQSHAAGREVFRVFLTADGDPPGSGADEWEALSFFKLVQTFRRDYSSLRCTPGFPFLRLYLAGVLQDICGFPREVSADCADPYAVATYLKTIDRAISEDTSHDAAR